MWNRIEKFLLCFKGQFSRIAAFKWFSVIVLGFMLRTEKLGITSVLRALSIDPRNYESIMHFFRADSWNLQGIQKCWYETVARYIPLFKVEKRMIIVGDGTKQSKEGRYMPCVKRLAQESETQSKPEFIHGHMWGGVGVLAGKVKRFFCVPLSLKIHDGLQILSDWKGVDSASHVVQMIRDGCCAANNMHQNALFLLDRYFLSVPALRELLRNNMKNPYKVEIITRLKKAAIAYEPAPTRVPGQRGRTRKKGNKVKLMDLFQSQNDQFKTQKLRLYDKKRNIRYYCLDLLWGQGLYQKLRFVLVEFDGTQSILVSSDLTLDPLTIIQLYSYRSRIENMFRELKQQIGGFCYHFWTKAMPKLNHFKRKTDPDPLSQVEQLSHRKRIMQTVRATEMYALMASISMGILQALSIDFSNGVFKVPLRYQRTPAKRAPSEANIMFCLRQRIFSLLAQHAENEIPRLILSAQIDDTTSSFDNAA